MTVNKKWSKEDIETIRKLVNKGLTSAQIAKQFYKVTRNSILGLCFRSGIEFPKTNQAGKALKDKHRANLLRNKALILKEKRAERRRQQRARMITIAELEQIKPPTLYPPPVANEESLLKTFMEIRSGECRAIIGEVNGIDTIYCAAPVQEGKSWCCKHHKIFTVPFQKKEESNKSVVDRTAN